MFLNFLERLDWPDWRTLKVYLAHLISKLFIEALNCLDGGIMQETSIVVAIVILTFIQNNLPEFFGIDLLLWMLLGVLIFATQYLGIGAVYCNIKDNEKRLNAENNL